MNKTRTKRLNKTIANYMKNGAEHIEALVQKKLNQPNRHGYRQHRRVSPRRQLKKLILRHGLV